jgi:hypothetical protein
VVARTIFSRCPRDGGRLARHPANWDAEESAAYVRDNSFVFLLLICMQAPLSNYVGRDEEAQK